MAKPQTVPEYLGRLSPDKRAALQRLRRTLRAILPRAEECISYGIPAFRVDGRVLLWFGASGNHCSFYPGGVIDQFPDELQGYDTRKGTVRFDPEDTLPASLVRKLVNARLARTRARTPDRRKKRPSSNRRRSA